MVVLSKWNDMMTTSIENSLHQVQRVASSIDRLSTRYKYVDPDLLVMLIFL